MQTIYRKVRKAAGSSMYGKYINCPEREIGNGLKQYYDGNLDRLLKVKRKYDPTRVRPTS